MHTATRLDDKLGDKRRVEEGERLRRRERERLQESGIHDDSEGGRDGLTDGGREGWRDETGFDEDEDEALVAFNSRPIDDFSSSISPLPQAATDGTRADAQQVY